MNIRKLSQVRADREREELATWNAWQEATADLETLSRIIAPYLPALPLPCTCHDGTCSRCEVERIVAQNLPIRT